MRETIDHGLKTFERALNKGPEKYTGVISISYTKEKTKVGFRGGGLFNGYSVSVL